MPPNLLLNVNVPPGVEPDGYVVTRLGKHSYGSDVVEKKDPRGRSYFWIGGNEYQHEDIPGSDCNAVLREKRVSVTPLMLDLTDEPMRAVVASWTIEGFARHGA
jgi:5'-nucleotidase